MNGLWVIACVGVASLVAQSGYAENPMLHGRYTADGVTYFSVAAEPSTSPTWARLGQRVSGFMLVAYDAKSEALWLEKDGRETQIKLKLPVVKVVSLAGAADGNAKSRDPERDSMRKSLAALVSRRDKTRMEMAALEERKGRTEAQDVALKELTFRLTLEEANLAYLTKAIKEAL